MIFLLKKALDIKMKFLYVYSLFFILLFVAICYWYFEYKPSRNFTIGMTKGEVIEQFKADPLLVNNLSYFEGPKERKSLYLEGCHYPNRSLEIGESALICFPEYTRAVFLYFDDQDRLIHKDVCSCD